MDLCLHLFACVHAELCFCQCLCIVFSQEGAGQLIRLKKQDPKCRNIVVYSSKSHYVCLTCPYYSYVRQEVLSDSLQVE